MPKIFALVLDLAAAFNTLKVALAAVLAIDNQGNLSLTRFVLSVFTPWFLLCTMHTCTFVRVHGLVL